MSGFEHFGVGPMKYTLLITQQCNLRCSYCYSGKKDSVMSLETAKSIVNTIFTHTAPDEKVDTGFFCGEPLLEFARIKDIVSLIENQPLYDPNRVELVVVTNGAIFSAQQCSARGKHFNCVSIHQMAVICG